MAGKAAAFFEKIENLLCVFFVFLLSTLPFIQLIAERIFHVPLLHIDTAMVNIVFLFACFTAIITWRSHKHICIAAIDEFAPSPIKKAADILKSVIIPLVLTALFFSAFSEFFAVFSPDDTVWGIPLRYVFALLPLSYAVMLFISVVKKKNFLFSLIGFVLGCAVSAGPLSGVLYYLFGMEAPAALSALDTFWLAFSADFFPALVILIIVFAFLGVPLFVVISAVSYVAFSQGGGYVEMLSLEAYGILTDKSIAAIPLFTMAGYILSKGSAGNRLIEVFKACFGWFKGGFIVAAVVVTTFFTTFTGVSGVTILALGSLLTIVLGGSGYSKQKSESLITASGALGLLFPPSLAIIMYGTTNYFSVDVFELFRGAVIPGCILAVSMIALGIFFDKDTQRIPFSPISALKALKHAAFELLLPIFIIAGYFSGFFSLFQAASFALLYTFCVGVWIRKDYSVKQALGIIIESLPVTGGVLAIFGAARGLSYYLLDANIPALLSDFVLTFVSSKYLFLLLLNCVLIIVGCLMDVYSAILIVSPLIIPLAESFGIHPVHTGIIFLMNMQLGFLTPPVGMDLFIASYAFDTPMIKVIKGILPFLLVQFIVLMLVTYIPFFTTALL
ncbi:TRAP transporter large permease subunit [Treponema sp. OMZ 840]|uniref:TRAP transporter large permease subunit n=1 Tax=Treponema sp. OMZ 840 TaxID=244313 RepID=UPI003D8D9D5C